MKRRRIDPTEEPQQTRRQPQTSCDSCRKRKLKCDRDQPCSSCVSRGLPCFGRPSVKRVEVSQNRSPSASDNQSILRRLSALERAVFNTERADANGYGEQKSQANATNTPLPSATETEYHQPTQRPMIWAARMGNLKIGIDPTSQSEPKTWFSNEGQATEQGCVWMMPRGQAMALLEDYLSNVYPLLPVIHGPTSRRLINEFYDRLSQAEQVKPQAAALILGIGAASAYFWQPRTGHHGHFTSAKEATQISLVWQDWSSDILTNTTLRENSSTLEGVQAWTLLSFMVQNVEGCSYRFKSLHSCSLVAAQALSLHLVDSPRSDQNEDSVSRELKRRLWWHIATTDWMLGFMGGPTDGSYSVQFRHMDVRYPRNVNDKDIHAYSGSTTLPLHIPTQMSYFLQKIRIGEIVRAILDSRHPGSPDVDITDYGRILALDHLFEQASRDLPPFFQSHDPIQIEKLNALEVQRVIIQLGLLSRRARLHRPFFLQADNDPQHQLSREICLQSTRTVVSLAISIIEISLNVNQLDANPASTPGPRHVADEKTRSREGLSVHRLGSVINHLSMACTALAFYAGTSSSGSNHTNSQGHGDSTADEPGPAAVRTELARACRVFTAIESESPMAAGLLRNVVSVLKRYRIQGVDTDQTLERIDHETRDSGAWEGPGLAETNPLAEPAAKVHEEMSDPVTGLNSAALSLDGLWDDFILGSAEDYTQLFADLDYYCGVT